MCWQCGSTKETLRWWQPAGMAGYGSGETIGVRKMGNRIYIVGDREPGAAPGCDLMAPRVGICANMQANTVLRILLDSAEA